MLQFPNQNSIFTRYLLTKEVTMRHIIHILTFALMLPALIFAGDLFFSEYIEGSSNNKAIEIYNPTGAAVDLSQYTVKAANNGSGWGCYTPTGGTPTADRRYVLPLTGSLNAGDVYVIYNLSASTSISDVGDLGFAYNNTADGGDGDNVPSFNGDDALGLFKDGTLIDVIGVPTTDPGDGWAVAGTATATKDYTLVRKSSVSQGNTDWTASSGTTTLEAEWIVYSKDTFTYLGSHVMEGGSNVAPSASAGTDRVERFDVTVTLDGSGSTDPDGAIVSYAWTQISGTSVTLSATNQATVTFTSPSDIAELEFQLAVTDDSSAVGKDTVTIYVNPSSIIISEYVEGSSNNKYLEIYNASDAPVNLSGNGYSIKKASNGAGVFDTDNEFTEWGADSILASGQTLVLANESHAIYTSPDIVVEGTYSVMSFNGNDAVGLFRNGLLVDVVGEPSNSTDIIKDMTLTRKSTILYGSSTYNVDEWNQYASDNIDNLGSHSTNPNAPVVSDITYTPEFVTSADEITVSATLTPVVGTIATATIYYGATGSLINTAEMWNETGNTWMGTIPAQTGNSIIEFYIACSDDQSPANSGQSSSQSVIIANSTPETIANIQANASTLNGQMVTIQGIVTIGAGVLASGYTSAYIQDESGRGLNLYDGTLYSDITRGAELLVVGYVDQYYTTVEVTDFTYKVISTGNDLPDVQSVTVAEANSSDWEGTLIEFSGQVVGKTAYTTATNISVVSGTDTTVARILTSTGIDTSAIAIGNSYKFKGVGYQYSSTYETLIGYAEDITTSDAIKEPGTKALVFSLSPAYPNPFNPETRINWQLSKNGKYELAVYNMLGQKIDVIGSGYATAGSFSKVWNASHFPSGVYFVQLKAENKVQTQKLLFLK